MAVQCAEVEAARRHRAGEARSGLRAGGAAHACPGPAGGGLRVGYPWSASLLIPSADPWTGFEAALGQFSDDFMAERVQPPVEEREAF